MKSRAKPKNTRKIGKKGFWSKLAANLKDHLLPHPGNKHTPHVIHHRALFGYSVLLVLLKVLVVTAGVTLPAASLYSSAITPNNIISLTNSTRESLGLTTLTENSALDVSAQLKAEDMLENQYFAHTSPEGVSPWSWFGKAGYTYTYAGENLAVYFTTAEDVQAGWMASPTHKANIVDTRYSEMGVGVSQGTYNGYPAIFVVEHFGYPKSVIVKAEPVEETPVAPVVEAPVATEQPIVKESEVVVIPVADKDSYALTVPVEGATEVTAHLGTESLVLSETKEGTFEGEIPYNPDSLSNEGEQLYVVAQGKEDETVLPVALVAPEANVKDVYAFEEPKNEKLFGFMNVENLDDHVAQASLIIAIFLGAMLAITLLAKLHKERLPLAAHALAVIALALILRAF